MAKTKGKKGGATSTGSTAPSASDDLRDKLIPLYKGYDYEGITEANTKARARMGNHPIRMANLHAAVASSKELKKLPECGDDEVITAMQGLLDNMATETMMAIRKREEVQRGQSEI